jgi:hypothetical protein
VTKVLHHWVDGRPFRGQIPSEQGRLRNWQGEGPQMVTLPRAKTSSPRCNCDVAPDMGIFGERIRSRVGLNTAQS